MLVRSDTLTRWRGEPINGLRHPRVIETLWSDEELAAVGLYRITPFVLPTGKRKVSGPTYSIVDGRAVESYVVEDIPPPTPEELEVLKDELVPPDGTPLLRAMHDLDSRLREQEGSALLTETQYRERVKSHYDGPPSAPRRRFVARSLAADAANNTTTLADVGLLGFVVAPREKAYFEFDAIFRTVAGTTGLALAVTGPANATLVYERRIPTSAAAAVNQMNVQQGSGNDATNTPTGSIDVANTDRLAKVSGIVLAGPNVGDGGLVRLRFRSEVAGSAVTVRGGSFVRAWFDEPQSPNSPP